MRGVALVPTARLDVLWLDNDFRVQAASFSDATLAEAQDVPAGSLISPPVAVASGPGRLDVFGLDRAYSLIHWAFTPGAPLGSRWSTADVIGVDMSSTPAAIAGGGNRIDLFCLGADRGMLHTSFDGSWSDWAELGGGFTSEPVVLAGMAGTFEIFARGLDFMIYHASWKPGGPADWQLLGGGLLGEPSAASAPTAVRVNNGILAFVATTDGAISYAEFDGTVWKPWVSLGNAHAATEAQEAVTFASEPVVLARSSGVTVPPGPVTGAAGNQGPAALAAKPPALLTSGTRVDVFGVGSDRALWQKTFDAQGWQPHWGRIDGTFACAPSIVAPSQGVHVVTQPPVRYSLAAAGTDGTVHRWLFDPTPPAPTPPGGVWIEFGPDLPRPPARLPSRYTFAVDQLQINRTRSAFQDTDVITSALLAGNWPLTTVSFAMPNDFTPGIYPLEDRFAIPATVELAEPVVFFYVITNNHDSGDEATITGLIVKGLEDSVNDALKSKKPDGADLGDLGSILGAGLISRLADQLVGFVFGGCDGLVAAEAISYHKGRDVNTQIATHGTGTPRKFEASTRNLRDDYPSGCHDSDYLVFTSITES